MQNLIIIYHVAQELRAFTLNDHKRTDSHSDYRVVDADFALVVHLNSKCHLYDLDSVLFTNSSPLYIFSYFSTK